MDVTMEYIARKANVSKATVSRVINNKEGGVSEETRARIKRLIDEYGYVPNLVAQSMTTSRTKTIGVVIPDIMNPYFPELVQAAELCLREYGYTVMLCNTSPSSSLEMQSIRTLLAKRVDGIILVSAQKQELDEGEKMEKLNVPCVLLDRRNDRIDYDVGIFVDNRQAFFDATELLLRHGNRQIAFIEGPPHFYTARERLKGYSEALEKHGISVDRALCVPGNFSYESGYNGVMALREKGVPFTAVLSCNDMMAFGALRALHELGVQVPDQVEIIGCDNVQFCDMVYPTMTTIGQPAGEIGRQAAKVMVELISGTQVDKRDIWLETKVIRRGSTRDE